MTLRFPRLYAAASLKHHQRATVDNGLLGFPRLYAAASLKQLKVPKVQSKWITVFRGFMPRPH